MEQTFKQRIAMQLLQLENIILGFSEGSIQNVYDSILSIAEEIDLRCEVVGDLVDEMDRKFDSMYLDDCYKKIKELEIEIETYRGVCNKLIQEVNTLRRGILCKDISHYDDVEKIILETHNNVDLRI